MTSRPRPDARPDTTSGPAAGGPLPDERTSRPWGARRLPAVIAALVLVLAAGALLFEAVWTLTGNAATAWWTGLTDELAGRPVDDTWILTGAAVAAAVGLWLVVLALTPGLRRQLPLRVPAGSHGRMRAVLDRESAALLLRDAAMRVPGVSRARVRVRRRRVKVRAEAGFRDPAEVRNHLTDAVRREQRDRLALARPPRLKVRVRRGPP
jgi:hypothetical protein